MSKIILYVLSIAFILLIGCSIWPYWNRYLINNYLEEAAIYGTKHGIADTKEFLQKKIEGRGYVFDPENLDIDKDENNAVTIAFTYHDQISFFGMEIKELEFSLEVTEKNIKTTL